MVHTSSSSAREEKLREALVYMESALRLLDEADAPGEIGAQLDLALCRLRDDISRSLPHSAG